MRSIQMRTPFDAVVAIAMVSIAILFSGSALAKAHHHKSGQQLLGAKIKQNGEHVIDREGKHTVSVRVTNGKVAGLKVKHGEKGDIPVKKYKSKQKLAERGGFHYAAFTPVQYQDLGVTYIGYSYVNDFGDEVIYWFPYEMILDGDTGAIDYQPLT